ncbi:MAG: hypothetical protein J0I07_36870 [Myxococcales bacterium]|nr:hypothetical protein [Myxococcales bacterium]
MGEVSRKSIEDRKASHGLRAAHHRRCPQERRGGRAAVATVIVKDGKVPAESPNRVAQTHDPTARAEILAIREACMKLGSELLSTLLGADR